MFGCMREMKAKVVNVGVRLKMNVMGWAVVVCQFADDTVLSAESEEELQGVVDEFYSVCARKKMKVNAEKSKAMISERREAEVVDFSRLYNMSVSAVRRYEVVPEENRKEEVKEFKYLGTMLCWKEK